MNEFDVQFKILEKELDHINDIASRMDNITQTTKNWAVITWAGSIALCLSNASLLQYMFLTGILPFIFFFIDSQWRFLQSRTMFRAARVREFLNDDRLSRSIKAKRFVDFTVYDPAARSYKNDDQYKKHVRFRKIFTFKEVTLFYLPLVVLSFILYVILYVHVI